MKTGQTTKNPSALKSEKIDEEKRISDMIAFNRPINLRFWVLFLVAGAFGLTTALSQPNLITLLNFLSILLTTGSLAFKNSSLIKSLIVFIEIIRGPAILYLGYENYLFWTAYSFQSLLIMFSDKALIAFAQLVISLSLHCFVYPKSFFSNVLEPLISSVHTNSQERTLIFIYSLLYSALICFYNQRNQQIDKLWADLTELKDKEIAVLRKSVTELKSENSRLSESIKVRNKDISQYLWMLVAHLQVAYEEAGNKIRNTVQKIDCYAQLLSQLLLNSSIQVQNASEAETNTITVTRTAYFFEKMWTMISSLVVDDSIKGQMKISRSIPRKLFFNSQKTQSIVLNVLIFLKEAVQTARFKINIEWDEIYINRRDSWQLLTQTNQIHTSMDSWKGADLRNMRATEIMPSSNYIILDSNQRLIRSKDLSDGEGAMEGRGMLRIKLAIRSSEELSTFLEQYFSGSLPGEEERREPEFSQEVLRWKKIAEKNLKAVVSLAKDSTNLLVRQKKRGTVSLEFYESAELPKKTVNHDNRNPPVEESNRSRWSNSARSNLANKEKLYNQSPEMQRSFARVYNIGSYPQQKRKKVLVVDGNRWSEKFFEIFFKKYEYAVITIESLEELLETVKVEYDTLDLIVINDWIGEVKSVKSALDIRSFLRIVSHGPIRTIIISETYSLEHKKLIGEHNDIKLLKTPLNLKELRETIVEES